MNTSHKIEIVIDEARLMPLLDKYCIKADARYLECLTGRLMKSLEREVLPALKDLVRSHKRGL
jgi:hypothetical protein